MLRAKLSLPLLSVAVGAALLAGCSSTKTDDKVATWSPNRILAEARDERGASNTDKAVNLYERAEGLAAGTPLAQQAQLEKAYTHYKANEKPQALAALDRFQQLHPASPAMDYALYLRGLVNFNDDLGFLGNFFSTFSKQDPAERDQKSAKESYNAFAELVRRFPDSKYAPDAQLRMRYIVNALAQYEVHVARYYYNRGAYVAAVNRAQRALTEYREVPAQEEALYVLVASYDKLGLTQLRDDAKRVLEKSYPQSQYLARGFAEKPWWKIF